MKDLREGRRLVVLYLAVVVVATAHATGLGLFGAGTFGASMVFVVIVGALLAATVVQADSPTRSDAFWSTHPFRRASMLAAKVVFALLVVLVAVTGQVIGVRSYDLHPFASASFVAAPALLFGVALLGVMLLASVTRDLRSFIIAALVIPVVVAFTMSVLDRPAATATLRPATPARDDLLPYLQGLGVAAGAALLAWLYLTRDGRWRIRMIIVAVVALTLMSMCSGSSTPISPPPLVSGPRPLSITIEPVGAPVPLRPGELPIVLRVSGASEGRSARVDVSSVELRLHDGAVLHAPLENASIDVGISWPSRFAAPRIPGVRWLVDTHAPEARAQVVPRLTAAQRRAIAGGVASIALDAQVSLWESSTSTTLPIAVGAETTTKGRRIRIVAWTPEDERSVLVVDESRVDTALASARVWASMSGTEGFALVNESRREAVPLYPTEAGSGPDGLVLPGAPLRTEQSHFGLRLRPADDTPPPDANWLRGARLMPVTRRFLGVYRVRAEVKDWPAAVSTARLAYSRARTPAAARRAER